MISHVDTGVMHEAHGLARKLVGEERSLLEELSGYVLLHLGGTAAQDFLPKGSREQAKDSRWQKYGDLSHEFSRDILLSLLISY